MEGGDGYGGEASLCAQRDDEEEKRDCCWFFSLGVGEEEDPNFIASLPHEQGTRRAALSPPPRRRWVGDHFDRRSARGRASRRGERRGREGARERGELSSLPSSSFLARPRLPHPTPNPAAIDRRAAR
jgi:hypothetical protein